MWASSFKNSSCLLIKKIHDSSLGDGGGTRLEVLIVIYNEIRTGSF